MKGFLSPPLLSLRCTTALTRPTCKRLGGTGLLPTRCGFGICAARICRRLRRSHDCRPLGGQLWRAALLWRHRRRGNADRTASSPGSASGACHAPRTTAIGGLADVLLYCPPIAADRHHAELILASFPALCPLAPQHAGHTTSSVIYLTVGFGKVAKIVVADRPDPRAIRQMHRDGRRQAQSYRVKTVLTANRRHPVRVLPTVRSWPQMRSGWKRDWRCFNSRKRPGSRR